MPSTVVQDPGRGPKLAIVSNSHFHASTRRHAPTAVSTEPSTSVEYSSQGYLDGFLISTSRDSRLTANEPVTETPEESDKALAAERKYTTAPHSSTRSFMVPQPLPPIFTGISEGGSAGTDYSSPGISTYEDASVLPAQSTSHLNELQEHMETLNVQSQISGSVDNNLPSRLGLSQIALVETTTSEDMGIPETNVLDHLLSPLTASQGLPQVTITTQKTSDDGLREKLPNLIKGSSRTWSLDFSHPVPQGLDISLESFVQSRTAVPYSHESIKSRLSEPQEASVLHSHSTASSSGTSELAFATPASKHTSVSILPTSDSIQSSITSLPSWNISTYINKIQTITTDRQTSTVLASHATSSQGSTIAIFIDTPANHAKTPSIKAVATPPNTEVSQSTSGAAAESSASVHETSITQWSTSKPPDNLPTRSTLNGDLPPLPTNTNPVYTTLSTQRSDSIFDTLKMSRSLPRQSFGISLGTASSAVFIFICFFLLHRPCYRYARRRRRGVILIGHESGTDPGMHVELLRREARNPEVSQFSVDS